MTIRNFTSAAVSLLLSLVGLWIIVSLLGARAEYQRDANVERLSRSLHLADHLRQTSEDLTRMARIYVSTGDPRHRDHFNRILAIRAGRAPRPADYGGFYWDEVLNGTRTPDNSGETVALRELMRREGFTEAEFALLKEAEDNSNELTNLEEVAMNALVGLFKDEAGRFTRSGPPDFDLARGIMFGAEYHAAKEKIMRPIDRFTKQIAGRVRAESKALDNRVRFYASTQVGLASFTALCLLYGCRHLRRATLEPLQHLTDNAQALRAGNLSIRSRISQRNEIGELGRTFDEMAEALDRDRKAREQAAQTALDEAELRARSVIDNVPDAIVVIDEHGIIQSFNPAATRIFGYSTKEAIGQNVSLLMPEADGAAHDDHIRHYLATGRGKVVGHAREVTARRRNGETFPLDIAVSRFEPGGKIFFTGILRDITERKQTEARLASREAAIRRLNDIISGPHDFEQTTADLLAAGADILGLETALLTRIENGRCEIICSHGSGDHTPAPGQVFQLDHDCKEAAWTSEQPVAWHSFERVADVGHPAFKETEIGAYFGQRVIARSTPYGTVSFFSRANRAIPFTEVEGDIVGIIARWLGRGLELEREKERLLQARNEADRANAAKSEFLSRMSHELRTPLNGINGFAQLLAKANLPDRAARQVNRIASAGRHLLELINEILDISRIEAGRMRISLESVRIDHVVRQSVEMVQPLADERSISISILTREEAPQYARADFQRLKQVLINLLSNAIKYNRTEGSVTVRWSREADLVRIEVADTGLGIPADQLPRAFEPFERIGAEKTKTEGTGLGLALTKRLMEVMHGQIEASSKPNVGSTFSILLRSSSAPREASLNQPDAPINATHPAGPLVLYIEDNPENLELVRDILDDSGNTRLISALQGGTGIEMARTHHPDIIILDLHLPDLDGDQVLVKLKGDPETQNIPVCMLSADAQKDQIRRLRGFGAAEYLTKPFHVDELIRVVAKLTGKIRSEDSRPEPADPLSAPDP